MKLSGGWRNQPSAIARALQSCEFTPTELLEMYLDRCAKLQPALNAFSYIDHDGAREAAAEATLRQREGKRFGPLDGIPISIKDNLYVRGLPAQWGSKMFQGHVPDVDDICVQRLREAGAVIVGKTTTPEFALMGRTQNRVTGVTRNPWDVALTPGGSSGGAVAAVASGMAPLAIGTDAGGSVRMPASYTGLVGLRPSNGRVPRRYGFPPMALDFQAIGLVGRSMADLDLLLQVTSGADRRDPTSINLPSLVVDERPLRIGWFTRIGNEGVDAEVESAHCKAREALADFGHTVVECEAPFDINELRRIWDALTPVGAARAARNRAGWENDATDQIASLVARGLAMSAADYLEVVDRVQLFRAKVSEQWGLFDAILTPTAAAPAWNAELDAPPIIGDKPGSVATQHMFCGWVNVLGFAGLSIPGEPHPDGRPIGLQIVAPFGNDGVALQIGRQLEAQIPWIDRWPAIASL